MGGRRMTRVAGPAGPALGVALTFALAIALGGCGAVETWRSLSGIDRNDPDPQTAPFTGNLAAGEAAPYPNLASVPPPPTRATTTAERQTLTQSLIADRNRAAADAGPPLSAPAGAAKPTSSTAAQFSTRSAEVEALPAGAPARTASNAPQPGAAQPGSSQSGRRKAGEPPDPGPPDSNLEMPQVRSVPEPEAARPAPPAPALAAVPRSPAAAGAAPLPASVANLMPEPAPPVPVMEPALPPSTGVKSNLQPGPDAQRKPEPKRAPATTVATLDIPGAAGTSAIGGPAPSGPDRAQIERVAGLYRDNPGTVRVIGYAAGPAAGGAAAGAVGGDPLASYHAALSRAQGVAKALAEAGIPAAKIQTEAAPAAGARVPGRVEIQFSR